MSTLKKFDLQAALAGAPVVTRDGMKILQIAHFKEASEEDRVICLGEDRSIFTTTEKGLQLSGCKSEKDLFMAPKIKTMYTEILCGEDGKPYNVDLKETLNEIPKDGVIATVTWEEPE